MRRAARTRCLPALADTQRHGGHRRQLISRIDAVVAVIGRIDDERDFIGLWPRLDSEAPGLEKADGFFKR